MSQNQQYATTLPSPSSSTASTPLYRVFRGLKSTQVIPIPSTNAAWRTTLNDLKIIYLQGRWKECDSKCLRLVGICKDSPIIHAYLLFLIGCCIEIHAINMHQYSAAKTKKMEDAAMWFEMCAAALMDVVNLPSEIDIKDVVSTPRTPVLEDEMSLVYDYDGSPLVQKKERIERLTKTISRLIDSDSNNPFCDETDPFMSNNALFQRKSLSNQPNLYSQSRLTPPPLRIRKDISLHVDIPSPPLSSMSFCSAETAYRDESMMSTLGRRDGGGFRSLASITEDMSDCTWTSETWNNCMMNRGQNITNRPYPMHSRDSSSVDDWNGFMSQAIYEARIEAKKEVFRAEIERRVAERVPRVNEPILVNMSSFASLPSSKGKGMPRSISDMIRDCLGKEGAEEMTPSCLRPMPRSSSAKPLPLCLKPKQTVRASDSDKASLARLEHAWEVACFGGWYMIDSDRHSLHVVEQSWTQLRERCHFNKIASNGNSDIEARITRFDHQLSSLVQSLQHNISDIHQLATDISHNRTLHLQTQKVPPSKSYWSFSALSQDVTDEKSSDDSDDDHHNTKDMRFNLGWAAPGTVLNENKVARIRRLRKDGFRTVGLRNEQRGHKGDEWYSYLCEEALKDAAYAPSPLSSHLSTVFVQGIVFIVMGYTAAFAFFEALWEAGVQYVFVNLGTDHPAIIEALVKGQRERRDQWPKAITCPNEMIALSMADGYARLTGRPQCVIVHVDVGTQGLAAAVHNASCGRAPVLIFAGLSPFTLEGELRGSRTEYIHWIQDVPDQKQIISQYCRYTGEIKTGKNVKQVVNRALQWATSDPQGPAYLFCAREIMEEEIEPYSLKQEQWVPVTGSALPSSAVEMIATELANAKEPLAIVGYNGRKASSVEELVRLANLVKGLRVVDCAGSDMSFPADHPGWLSLHFGRHDAVKTADFILVVDSDTPWIPTVCKPKDTAKVVHLDVDPLKQQIPMFYLPSIATFKVDSTTAFKQINDYIASNSNLTQTLNSPEVNERQKSVEESYRKRLQDIADSAVTPAGGPDAYLNANYLMGQLKMAAPPDTIWAIEAVTLTLQAADHLQFSDDQHGGKNKGKFVCQIVGDGTFLFSIPGSVYWIARRYNIPILTIVLNNKGWNAPRRSLLLVHPDGEGSKASNEEMNISFDPTPDYARIAKAAAGGELWAGRASTVGELAEKLPQAIQSVLDGKSAVLEAQLDGTAGKYVGK
ncbi:hypothetical protein EYB25_000373 [Talaromyces marneffei]|nr:hypothetical protein EYB25_000373 [Talaromyces marneffei]